MSKKILNKISIFLSVILLFTSCSNAEATTVMVDESLPPRDSTPVVLQGSADGVNVMNGNVSSLDISNVSKGYFMLSYSGSSPKVMMQITKAGETTYTYEITDVSEYTTFPLAPGSGDYTITINENIQGTSYATVDNFQFSVALENDYQGFLYSSYYVNFDESSTATTLSKEIVAEARTELDAVAMIYDYVTSTIEYDYDFAAQVSTFYIPDTEKTISTEKGLCFDYAVLMTSMLRAQRIPTRLVLGYAGDVYHAWISVHTEEHGWINNAIEFNGESWVRMDPTFDASSGGRSDVLEYIGDGENYNAMYYY